MKSEKNKISQPETKQSNNLTKQIVKGGSVTFLGKVSGNGIKFFLQIMLTRFFGIGAYGLYALGINVLGIASIFSQMGFQFGAIRFGSIYQGESKKSLLKGTLIISLISSFLGGIILGVLLYLFSDFISINLFHDPNFTYVLKIFSITLPFYTLLLVSSTSARIFRKMQYDVGVRLIFHPMILIIATAVSFILGYNLDGVLYGFLISSIFSAIVSVNLLNRLFPSLISDLSPDFSEVKELTYFSLTVLLSSVSSVLVYKIDKTMLGIFSTTNNVGIYNAAAIMAGQATIFLGAINPIFTPIIADLFNKKKYSELSRLFKATTRWSFTMTLPIILIMIFFSKKIMAVYGAEFIAGSMVLVGLGLSQLLNAAVGSAGYILTMTGYQKWTLTNNLILGLLNILLNYILIPMYGLLGATLATGISIGLVNIAKVIEIYVIHKIQPYQVSYWKPLLAALVASIIIYIFPQFNVQSFIWIGKILVFIILYISLLISLGFSIEDKLILKTMGKKIGIN